MGREDGVGEGAGDDTSSAPSTLAVGSAVPSGDSVAAVQAARLIATAQRRANRPVLTMEASISLVVRANPVLLLGAEVGPRRLISYRFSDLG